VSGGRSVFSFTQVADAADAVVAALASDATGAFNIVDDEPAPMAEWLPIYAERMGGPPPGRAPAAIARLLAGSWGLAFMTRLRGADNARAKQLLQWQPAHATWRDSLGRPGGAAVREATQPTPIDSPRF
jgi:nucleoside-diphosphate-sugar epimerase